MKIIARVDVPLLRDLCALGLSLYKIADRLTLDRATVKRMIAFHQIPYVVRSQNRAPEQPGEQARIDALRAEGKGVEAIMRILGRSRSFVEPRTRPPGQRGIDQSESRARMMHRAPADARLPRPNTDIARALCGRRYDDMGADVINAEPGMALCVPGHRLTQVTYSPCGNSSAMMEEGGSVTGFRNVRLRARERSLACGN